MQTDNETLSVAEITAFLIIECGVSIDINDIDQLSLQDPLVQALFEAWRVKQDRESERFGLIASITANVAGNKTRSTDFFSPLSTRNKTAVRQQNEKAMKAMFAAHNQRLIN